MSPSGKQLRRHFERVRQMGERFVFGIWSGSELIPCRWKKGENNYLLLRCDEAQPPGKKKQFYYHELPIRKKTVHPGGLTPLAGRTRLISSPQLLNKKSENVAPRRIGGSKLMQIS